MCVCALKLRGSTSPTWIKRDREKAREEAVAAAAASASAASDAADAAVYACACVCVWVYACVCVCAHALKLRGRTLPRRIGRVLERERKREGEEAPSHLLPPSF